MKKDNERLKKCIEKIAKKIAVNSVGRSIPMSIHEPKVPKKLLEK